jgi:hypothetical protein
MTMKPKTNFEEHFLKNLGAFQSIDIEKDWQNVKERIGKDKTRKLNPLWRMAAAVILLLGIGFVTQKYLYAQAQDDRSIGRGPNERGGASGWIMGHFESTG